MQVAREREPGRFDHAWRALRHRNFRLYFFGQGISVMGSWMTRVAITWLVYRLTKSALMLGVVAFLGQIVASVLGPVAGVWVERWPRRTMLVWTQAAAAAQSLALAGLTLSGRINLTEIIILAILQGLINAFDMPGRQSFLVQMVEDRNDLGNAIAINSTVVNGARLIGPALAGFVIAWAGEGWCFLIDGVSYFAVIASLIAMRLPSHNPVTRRGGMQEQLQEGWDYVTGVRPVRTTLLVFALVSLMGYPVMVLLPVFAAEVLHGNATTLGWLSGASGAGALLSALSLTVRKNAAGLLQMVLIATVLLGGGLVGFGLSHVLWLSMLLMVIGGFGLMQVASACNTILQALVTEDKRARVMSYYTTAFFGAAPIGSLLAGALAHRIGAPITVMITGGFCLLGAVWFSMELRHIGGALHSNSSEASLIGAEEEAAREGEAR
ncbi:MFS transporter [Bryocella elongata]|nr:MFS transporter [Bryocella elongata]